MGYKAQAREIVCNHLTYEPPIELSVLGELRIRNALKKYDHGEITKITLEEIIEFHSDVINSIMMECAEPGIT
ncbi:hypothetical protein [uncultured Croceitalea sp.]|uniref:hypothetical protein n=1 Tax=uncultured Croceitalea sp. TaxID=1798908 RepID=UPI00374EAE36